jgi:hypothetical protein
VLDTLGEAYAEASQFAQAITFANRALELAEAKGDHAMAAEIRSRIELYRNNSPYRE